MSGKEQGARDAVLVENAIDDGWIEIHDIEPHQTIQRYDLETGETEVLSLALAHEHDEVLVNEESVRDVARLHDLRPRGTLYFLFVAIREGEITFDDFLELLETLLEGDSIWMKPSIWRRSARHVSWLPSMSDILPTVTGGASHRTAPSRCGTSRFAHRRAMGVSRPRYSYPILDPELSGYFASVSDSFYQQATAKECSRTPDIAQLSQHGDR